MKTLNELRQEYNETVEKIKKHYDTYLFVNSDIEPLANAFKKLGLNFYDFKPSPDLFIRESIEKEVICANMDLIKKYNPLFNDVVGYFYANPETKKEDVFYTHEGHAILTLTDKQQEEIENRYKQVNMKNEAFDHFNKKVKPFLKPKGEKLEIYEHIFFFFLECLPPLRLTRNNFYMSEPLNIDENGKPLYYYLSRSKGKYFIQIDILR